MSKSVLAALSWVDVFHILVVIKNNPVIELLNLREKVLVVPRWWAVIYKPGIQNGCKDKLIFNTGMVPILFRCFFEMYV